MRKLPKHMRSGSFLLGAGFLLCEQQINEFTGLMLAKLCNVIGGEVALYKIFQAFRRHLLPPDQIADHVALLVAQQIGLNDVFRNR